MRTERIKRETPPEQSEPAPGAYPDSGPFMRMMMGFAALAIVERLPRALARRLRPRIAAAVEPRR